MPEPTCPFCEAPLVNVRTIPATEHCLGIEEKTFACDTMLLRVLTEGASKSSGQLSALCESRQRLFDDVLARSFAQFAAGEAETSTASELDVENADRLGITVEAAVTQRCANGAMREARIVVNRRYPLPAKDAPDATKA